MSAELKPCPFCGGEATRMVSRMAAWSTPTYATGCGPCGVMFIGNGVNTPASADADWNRRAAELDASGREEEADPKLPCDVAVAPATIIGAGCKLSTLLDCISLRNGRYPTPRFTDAMRARIDSARPPVESAPGFDYVEASRRLWALLDDIDTQDDACRDNDRAFRDHVRKIQQRRFDVMTDEHWDSLPIAAPAAGGGACTHTNDAIGSDRMRYCLVCGQQKGYDHPAPERGQND